MTVNQASTALVCFFAFCNFAVFTICITALASMYGFIDIRSYWGGDPITEYLEAAAFFGLFTAIQAGAALRFYFSILLPFQKELEDL